MLHARSRVHASTVLTPSNIRLPQTIQGTKNSSRPSSSGIFRSGFDPPKSQFSVASFSFPNACFSLDRDPWTGGAPARLTKLRPSASPGFPRGSGINPRIHENILCTTGLYYRQRPFNRFLVRYLFPRDFQTFPRGASRAYVSTVEHYTRDFMSGM